MAQQEQQQKPGPGRWLWRLAAAAGLLALGLVAAVVVTLSTIDPNDYRDLLSGPIKEATGRDFSVSGDVELKIGVPVALAANGLGFANAEWGSQAEMASIKRIEVELRLLPLIWGELRFERLLATGIDVLLETDPQGRRNWEFEKLGEASGAPQPTAGAGGEDFAIPFFRTLALREMRVIYRDERSGETQRLSLDKLDFVAEGYDSPETVALAATVNDIPVELTGTVGPLLALFRGGQPYPVDLKLAALGATLGAKGSIARPLRGEGLELLLDLQAQNLGEEAQRLGLELPAVPAIALTGRLTDPEGGYAIDSLQVTAGDSGLTGKVSLSLAGDRPKVEAALGSQVVNVVDLGLGGAGVPSEAPQDTGRLIPDVTLPAASLDLVDLDLALSIDRLVLAEGVAAEQVALEADLKGGKLTLSPRAGQIADGRLEGVLNADPTGAMATRIEATGVSLGRLLAALGASDAVRGGPTDATVDLNGQGGDLRELMASLDGQVKIVIGEGEVETGRLDLVGGDVVSQIIGAVDPFSDKDATTKMRCGVLRASVKSGVATFDQGIGFETSKMDILGAGTVNLGTEALDLGFDSEAKGGIGVSVADIVTPLVRVRGTMANPTIGVSAQGAVKSTAEKAAKVGGAIMSGGFSLLGGGLADRAGGSESPCRIALGEAAAKAEDQAGEPKDGEDDGGLIEDVTKGITEGIGKIFGD